MLFAEKGKSQLNHPGTGNIHQVELEVFFAFGSRQSAVLILDC